VERLVETEPISQNTWPLEHRASPTATAAHAETAHSEAFWSNGAAVWWLKPGLPGGSRQAGLQWCGGLYAAKLGRRGSVSEESLT
jgi:hypothetical protein